MFFSFIAGALPGVLLHGYLAGPVITSYGSIAEPLLNRPRCLRKGYNAAWLVSERERMVQGFEAAAKGRLTSFC